MKLLDDIVEKASSDDESISDLLRKGLVLSYKLKNDTLKSWVTNELNGYNKNEDLPQYRIVRAFAKGDFQGAFGSSIKNQPIPPVALKKEHRDFAERIYLRQPISAYIISKNENGSYNNGMVEWPPDLVLSYVSRFYQGDYALVSAWQEIPFSVMLGLNDTVRTRLLQIALDLQDELGIVGKDDVSAIPEAKVEPIMSYHIYGGNNVITGSARDIAQNNHTKVSKNDFDGLSKALHAAGVTTDGITELKHSMQEDAQSNGPPMGNKVQSWVAGLGRFLGPPAVDVATKALEGYFGLT